MLNIKSKKGQVSPGLITGLVFGGASLVIAAIVAFVIVSTLTGANLLTGSRTTGTVTNETHTAGDGAWVNESGFTLAGASVTNVIPDSYTITAIWNASTGGEYNISAATNLATVSAGGVVTNATAVTMENVTLSYTYSIKGAQERSSDDLSFNFTSGVDNVSAKIPTVLLVAAIVLILGVLVLLVGAWQRMRVGGGI